MPVVTYDVVDGEVLGETRDGAGRTYVPDPLGSTAALIDSSGNITDEWEYWPYGEVRSHAGSSETPFTYLGTLGYYSDGAGRYYVRARSYRADLGRWTTVDPLWPEEPAYAYCRCDPLGWTDPSGSSASGRVGACGVHVCYQWGEGYPAVPPGPTHQYVCVTGPHGGCAGGLYPASDEEKLSGKPGQVLDGEKTCKSRRAKEGYMVHCDELSNRTPEGSRCGIAKAVCECVRYYRKHPPAYRIPLQTCYQFPSLVLDCALKRVVGAEKADLQFIIDMRLF
jgi:RHS repeat-associated protein